MDEINAPVKVPKKIRITVVGGYEHVREHSEQASYCFTESGFYVMDGAEVISKLERNLIESIEIEAI